MPHTGYIIFLCSFLYVLLLVTPLKLHILIYSSLYITSNYDEEVNMLFLRTFLFGIRRGTKPSLLPAMTSLLNIKREVRLDVSVICSLTSPGIFQWLTWTNTASSRKWSPCKSHQINGRKELPVGCSYLQSH